MIPTEAFAGIRKVIEVLEGERDTALTYKRSEENMENFREASFWAGKYCGLAEAIGILKDRVAAWETDNERELEEMAEERSEKDCLWEGRD